METIRRSELMPGVFLTSVHTNKFKSSLLSVTLLTPLSAQTAAVNALIPSLLRRGSQAHPDMQSLAAALDEMYGGSIDPVVRKKGETQCVGFLGSFLDDAYSLDHSAILPQAAELMGELLLRPYTVDGAFCPDYTRQEKANLADRIRAEVNDKRQYAVNRVVEEMCTGEPYAVSPMGRQTDVDAITPQSAWAQYADLLAHSRVEFYYCGSAQESEVRSILKKAFGTLPREGGYELKEAVVVPAAQSVRQVSEPMDVAQGKLTMGFRTGGVTAVSEEYPALVMCNALFGGTTTAKLFLNVREKLSLCYYASSSLQKFKGLMVVSSGVEFSNKERAENEILAQLDACRSSQFEPWEVDGARRYTVSSLLTIPDSQGRQEDWWLGQAVLGLDPTHTPQALADRIEAVTLEQAVAMAQKLSLDTVYFLTGKEG